MLSAPVKSAKRISSLFSLGSHKEQNSNGSAAPSPGLNSPSDFSQDRRRRSSSRPTRHVSTPNALYSSEPRTVPHPEPFDLPPPPSLLAVNQDLATSAPSSPIDRPGSRGRDMSMSRPSSSAGLAIPGSAPDSRPSTPSKRRSWMPGMGARSRAGSMDRRAPPPMLPAAWIAGLDQKVVYDMGPLSRGEQISELWNEQGDTYVYLFPQNTGRPASFKVDSTVFAESPSLNHLCRGADPKSNGLEQPTRSLSLGNPISPPLTPQDRLADNDNDSSGSQRMAFMDDVPDEDQELHLYLPIPLNGDVSNLSCRLTQEDTETLLLFRNLFAFLLGQSLIASPKSSTLFSIFMDVAVLLARFEFSNLDGSNFGETATSSFSNYCDELRLADVRKSREKTIEAIVLGERLRYYPLYVEGFVHGVGKLDEIKQLRSPKFTFIHPITQKRLERGFIDLDSRLRGLYGKLEDFDFPSVFSGIANSTTSVESKVVRFKTWKAAFLEFRRFTMSFYRTKYGSWPPKARSKKNEFEESGLNRLLLLDLYRDFCDLYDMLVDRTDLTTRTIDLSGAGGDAKSTDHKDVTVRAVRQVLSEYDRSTPPVLPPIPFDIPQMPNLQPLHRKPLDAKKEAKQRGKKLKNSDINAVLMGSYTRESIRSTQFIEEFMKFERRCAHGKSVDDLVDMRCGQWIFLYSVIQSMPMLTVDVPEVQFTQGVEYFLCIAPRGGAPWIQNDTKTARSWFGVAGGAGVVSLPSDVVINGVEGVYRRSHCWQLAEQWAEAGALLPPPNVEDVYEEDESSISSPYPAQQSSAGSSSDPQPGSALGVHGGLTPPPPAIPRTRSPGAGNRAEHRHSIYPGLEALPLPAGIAPIEPPARPMSRFNPNMSFDDILREVPDKNKKKR